MPGEIPVPLEKYNDDYITPHLGFFQAAADSAAGRQIPVSASGVSLCVLPFAFERPLVVDRMWGVATTIASASGGVINAYEIIDGESPIVALVSNRIFATSPNMQTGVTANTKFDFTIVPTQNLLLSNSRIGLAMAAANTNLAGLFIGFRARTKVK